MKHFAKKLTCLLMTVLMLAVMILPVAAEELLIATNTVPAAWDGTVAGAFAGGTGTEADPYLISNAQELALIASNVNNSVTDYLGVYFKQTANINLDGAAWTSIGYSKKALSFKGNYDGDHFTIYNILNVPEDPTDEKYSIYNGLFGWVEGSTIQNIQMVGGSVTGTKYAGAVVGYLIGGTVYNCVSDIEFVTGWQIGGVVGRAEKGESNLIKGCVNHTKVYSMNDKDSSNAFVGGIIGGSGNTEIRYCANYGEIIASNATSYCVAGGIIGIQGASSSPTLVDNCMDMGIVSVNALDSTANIGAGGICGKAAHVSFAEITNCFTAGTYSSNKEDFVGGIAGLVDPAKVVSVDNLYTTFEKAAGTDALGQVSATILKEDEMKGVAGIAKMGLDSAWVAEGDMLPQVDVTKIAAAEADPGVETTTTTEETTTTAAVTDVNTTEPDVTTTEPAETEPAETEPVTTTVPAQDDTPEPAVVKTRDNTILIAILSVAIVAVVGAMAAVVIVSKKKK